MSLEQAILDRLEKRNAQIAQLQSTVHALERAADSQREHAMMERGLLLEENKKLAELLDRAAETIAKMGTGEVVKHPHIDWQVVATNLQNEIARLNAKVGPLEKLYEVVKKHVDHGAIIDNRADIYDAVAETAKALSQLTA